MPPAEMPAAAPVTAVLADVAAFVGRPLTDIETVYVLATLASWAALVAAGMPPAAVAAIVRKELAATALH